MPPKKHEAAAGTTSESVIKGFNGKETMLLAAAFVASIDKDKYDFDLMAVLSGYAPGTLKKFFPAAKRKAIEVYPSFGTFLGGSSAASSGAPKANGAKKRKTASDADDEVDSAKDKSDADATAGATADEAAKKPAATKLKGRPKKVKAEDAPDGETPPAKQVAGKGKGRGRPAAKSKAEDKEDEKPKDDAAAADDDATAAKSEIEDEV